MEKQTSDEVSSLAGRILSQGNPLDDEDALARVVSRLVAGGWNTSQPTTVAVHNLKTALHEEFGDVFAALPSLAGSALSQDVASGS